jgi:DNA-binding HxlR family transcriptional regulator
MDSSTLPGYCSFTKAIEHLGDRWSLLIVRELGVFGPQGFNELAGGLPGRISRSVLAERLRRLETLGVVSRGTDGATHHPQYRLTSLGLGLMPALVSLRSWAETWLPDDPEMVEREPAIVVRWLAQRVDPERLPDRQVVLEFRILHRPGQRYWLVVHRGSEPYGCLTDPLLDERRYVYLEVAVATLLALARGSRSMADVFEDGSLTASGPPDLTSRLAGWFRPTEAVEPTSR